MSRCVYAKSLTDRKYAQRIVRARKGKGSYKRKQRNEKSA